MAGTSLRKAALLLAVVTIVSGCGPNGPSPSGKSSPGATASASSASSSDEPASSATPSVPQEASAIEQVVYFLVGDSTGTTTGSGTQIILLFEPGGRATLFATSASEKLGHHGTWQYEDGQLSLAFTAEDFKPHATFALNLDDTTVTMPFLVFDTGSGTSTWKRGSLALVSKTTVVFQADAEDPDSTLTPDQAVDETVTVAQGMADSGDPDIDVLPTAMGEPTGLALAAANRSVSDVPRAADDKPPAIKSVTKLSNGLHVEFENAPAVEVSLFDLSVEPTTYTTLVPGPIASDPRVRLDPEPNGDSDDPASKTAVFIAPFSSPRVWGGFWTVMLPGNVVAWAGGNPNYIGSDSAYKWYEHDDKVLTDHGYHVTTIVDDDVTLTNIIQALGGTTGQAPGVVIIQTHGGSGGNLTTGVDLGPASDYFGDMQRLQEAVAEVAKIAPDFDTFEGGTAAHPKTVELSARPYENDPIHGDFFISLTPAFWRWLGSRGVSFKDSLVFIASCATDKTPNLREAIQAKAYFAWSDTVNASLNWAVANYLVDSLVRKTHSAEEAYYNIVRVVSTGQRIYDEDQDFAGVMPKDFARGTAFLDFFRGYGWDRTALVPYATNGWFDITMNQGDVWWLVFAGRWDLHAGAGVAALVACEKNFWAAGDRAELRDPFCNSAAPGGIPTADEVAYATYVLTGKKVLPFSGTFVPRVTLVDGQP